jgi:hypothetical protein
MSGTLNEFRPRVMAVAYRILGSVAENSSFPIGIIDERCPKEAPTSLARA